MFSLSSNYTTYTTPYPSNRLHKATNYKTLNIVYNIYYLI